jgi:predicted ribosome quality control (RQC) complex YloA/Tae2 family protein
MIDKLSTNKKQNEVDVNLISKAQDAKDIEDEIEEQLSARIQKTKEEKTQNKDRISKVEKEIHLIDEEIKRINERKKQNLLDAMEIGDKWVATTIKKPRTFTKITRFFSSKFNTPKLITKTIIDPLNLRIEEFVNNELANVKG